MTRKTPQLAVGSYLLDASKAVAAAAEQTNSPNQVRIFPAGAFRADDGRPQGIAAWVCDKGDANRIIAAFDVQTDDLLIDYDHAWYKNQTGKTTDKVVAAGWITAMEWRDGDADAGGGLWATVEWTPVAAAHIQNREYRHISPVFGYDPKTGHVMTLAPCALTNHPAIDGLVDLAAASAQYFLNKPTEVCAAMDELIQQMRWMLNLPVAATKEEIVAELEKLISQLKAEDTAAVAMQVAALTGHLESLHTAAAANDPKQFVPVSQLEALQKQVTSLTAAAQTAEVQKLVAAAKAEGKIVAANEKWANDLGMSNLAALQEFIKTAPVVVALGSTQTGGVAPTGAAASGDAAVDAKAISVAATAYQNKLAADGIVIDSAAAVRHVTKGVSNG